MRRPSVIPTDQPTEHRLGKEGILPDPVAVKFRQIFEGDPLRHVAVCRQLPYRDRVERQAPCRVLLRPVKVDGEEVNSGRKKAVGDTRVNKNGAAFGQGMRLPVDYDAGRPVSNIEKAGIGRHDVREKETL